MAEPSAADERWIVKEREDGRNVNSWHWEEKQRLPWARERLETVLLVSAASAARITRVKEVTGEAMTTTRKGGKRFAVYDLKVTASWSVGEEVEEEEEEEQAEEDQEGGGGGGGSKAKAKEKEGKSKPRTGTVVIEELASTHDPDDYVITFTADGSADADAAARDEAKRLLTEPLLAALEKFCEAISAL
jgi:activator of HSP90 ATPase